MSPYKACVALQDLLRHSLNKNLGILQLVSNKDEIVGVGRGSNVLSHRDYLKHVESEGARSPNGGFCWTAFNSFAEPNRSISSRNNSNIAYLVSYCRVL